MQKNTQPRVILSPFQPNSDNYCFFQVPPGNNVGSDYRLRVEGAGIGGGAIIFENETKLEFSEQFLSISISTNRLMISFTREMKENVTVA